MALFSSMTEKATKEWAQNITLEQIEELEKQGCDMTEYRVIYAEQQAEKQRIAEAVDLSLLDKFKKIRTPDFIDEVTKFNKLSDKKKQKLEDAPLVYGRVVQAHSALFKSDPKNKNGCGIVFLYALDDAHRYDEEWLAKTANRISNMKETVNNQPETGVEKFARLLGIKDNFIYSMTIGLKQERKKAMILPEDCREFIQTLCLDGGSFHFKLGETLSDGADAYCTTFSLWDQSKLPMAQIPHKRIIPFLLTDNHLTDDAALIPPVYYVKV